MSIWYIGSPFFACLVIGNSVLRANGDSIKPSGIIIITSLTNAILDPIFIFGWGPLNAMGIQGAAIATAISYILGMNIMITIIRNENLLSFPSMKILKLLKFCFPVLVIGLPAAFTIAP